MSFKDAYIWAFWISIFPRRPLWLYLQTHMPRPETWYNDSKRMKSCFCWQFRKSYSHHHHEHHHLHHLTHLAWFSERKQCFANNADHLLVWVENLSITIITTIIVITITITILWWQLNCHHHHICPQHSLYHRHRYHLLVRIEDLSIIIILLFNIIIIIISIIIILFAIIIIIIIVVNTSILPIIIILHLGGSHCVQLVKTISAENISLNQFLTTCVYNTCMLQTDFNWILATNSWKNNLKVSNLCPNQF